MNQKGHVGKGGGLLAFVVVVKMVVFSFLQGQSALDISLHAQNSDLAKRLRLVRYEQGLDIKHPMQSFTTNKVTAGYRAKESLGQIGR